MEVDAWDAVTLVNGFGFRRRIKRVHIKASRREQVVKLPLVCDTEGVDDWTAYSYRLGGVGLQQRHA